MERFVSCFSSFISNKEKGYQTGNSRTRIRTRDLKIQTGVGIIRQHRGSQHQYKLLGPNELHPSLLLEERGDKRSCYSLSLKTLGKWGRDGQVIKHHFEHKEKDGKHLNMSRSQEGQVVI